MARTSIPQGRWKAAMRARPIRFMRQEQSCVSLSLPFHIRDTLRAASAKDGCGGMAATQWQTCGWWWCLAATTSSAAW